MPEGKREGCLLAGSTQRRPVLASPAPPRRPAVRRPDPTGPWCVRVLDSTGYILDSTGTSWTTLRTIILRAGCRFADKDQAFRAGLQILKDIPCVSADGYATNKFPIHPATVRPLAPSPKLPKTAVLDDSAGARMYSRTCFVHGDK